MPPFTVEFRDLDARLVRELVCHSGNPCAVRLGVACLRITEARSTESSRRTRRAGSFHHYSRRLQDSAAQISGGISNDTKLRGALHTKGRWHGEQRQRPRQAF